MNVRFLSKGLEMDDRTKDYILKRLERLEKLVDPVSEFEVEVDMDKKGKFRVEVMIKTPHTLYRAEDTTESVEGSIDIAVDELEIQIVRGKNRFRDLIRRGARSIKKRLAIDKDARF